MNFFKSQHTIQLEDKIKELEQTIENFAPPENFEKIAELTEEIRILTEANAAIPELESKVQSLEEKIKTLDGELLISSEKINLAAAQKLAAMGHGEILELGHTPNNAKPNLTGLAKVTAAIKAQNVSKTSQTSN